MWFGLPSAAPVWLKSGTALISAVRCLSIKIPNPPFTLVRFIPAHAGEQSCMAPNIVQTVLEGRQPASLSARMLLKVDLPVSWDEQRRMLGLA